MMEVKINTKVNTYVKASKNGEALAKSDLPTVLSIKDKPLIKNTTEMED